MPVMHNHIILLCTIDYVIYKVLKLVSNGGPYWKINMYQ